MITERKINGETEIVNANQREKWKLSERDKEMLLPRVSHGGSRDSRGIKSSGEIAFIPNLGFQRITIRPYIGHLAAAVIPAVCAGPI